MTTPLSRERVEDIASTIENYIAEPNEDWWDVLKEAAPDLLTILDDYAERLFQPPLPTCPEQMARERMERWNGYWTMNMGDSPDDEAAYDTIIQSLSEKAERLEKNEQEKVGATDALPDTPDGRYVREHPVISTQTDPDERFSGTIEATGEHAMLRYSPKDKMAQCPHTIRTAPSPGPITSEDEAMLLALNEWLVWSEPLIEPKIEWHSALAHLRARLSSKPEAKSVTRDWLFELKYHATEGNDDIVEKMILSLGIVVEAKNGGTE